MQKSITISKNPELSESLDYELLREKGIDYIQNLGSSFWTDYNIHDPGITLLELFCYAISDLGYRSSLDIKDLLAFKQPEVPDYNRQGFYTAREILTINPLTVEDYRKLLIDIDGVKNSWLTCRDCPCNNIFLYADCKKNILKYDSTEHTVIIKGLYDVSIEFEDEEGIGNLNSGKIKYNFNFETAVNFTNAAIEIRLPSWQKLENDKKTYEKFRNPLSEITDVNVLFISGDKSSTVDIADNELATKLRGPVYVTFQVEFKPDKNSPDLKILDYKNVPMTIWFRSNEDRKSVLLPDIKTAIEDSAASGIMSKYHDKIIAADKIIANTFETLNNHRNIAEDFCVISAIEVEDISVCADMELEPDIDTEAAVAEAYYRIDNYFSPEIYFYSLKELLDKGVTADEIFEGPKLNNGFIDNDQLKATDLKKILYTSDIINLIMDIPGVKAVKNLVFARYDKDGFLIESQPWKMYVTANHQPRLYIEGSKILVFKNGLPFLPDSLELSDTLQVITGKNSMSKLSVLDQDLPVPTGTWYDLAKYFPLQYSLPLTYNAGYEGLPSSASAKRIAQAKQLKAYLMFFEQLFVNYLEQLSHIKDLFAIDDSVDRTYYSRFINDNEITGVEDLYKGLTADKLRGLEETEEIFYDRRNRFLDHLLSRFSEQFSDYALMLYSYSENTKVAVDKLIKNKIAFLKDYPIMGYEKSKSFNYKDPVRVCDDRNISGFILRILRLLGIRQFSSYFEIYKEDNNEKPFEKRWRLKNKKGNIILSSSSKYTGDSLEEAETKALEEISAVTKYIVSDSNYEIKKIKKWTLNLLDDNGKVIATRKQSFETKTDAEKAKSNIIEFAKKAQLADYFELYDEPVERRWRLKNEMENVILSSSVKYTGSSKEEAEAKALEEISIVKKYITSDLNYEVAKIKKWKLSLLDNTGKVIAVREEQFNRKSDAEKTKSKIIEFAKRIQNSEKIYLVEHVLLRPRNKPGTLVPEGDSLLPICIPENCNLCGEEDPYSFRITIVMNGEEGIGGSGMEFRRFAEETIRLEAPAHLGVKVCWISSRQLEVFGKIYCNWLKEISKPKPNETDLSNCLHRLICILSHLKNIYPPAYLHDCEEGSEESRVFLNQTVI